MKNKIIGIFIITLLIGTTALQTADSIKTEPSSLQLQDTIFDTYIQVLMKIAHKPSVARIKNSSSSDKEYSITSGTGFTYFSILAFPNAL